MFGGVADGPDFDFGGTGRDAHDELEVRGEEAAVAGVDLADEAADHHFCRIEVGDHSVAERTDGLDARIGLFVHEFGLLAEGNALARAIVDGHDGRLVQHDLVILENDGVGGAEVDGQFLIQKSESHIGCF